MSEIELLPCRHCDADKAYTRMSGTGYQIVCGNCGIQTATASNSEAIAAWNRSPPQVGRGMEDAARLILECTDIISEATAGKLAERIRRLGSGSREERSQADPGEGKMEKKR